VAVVGALAGGAMLVRTVLTTDVLPITSITVEGAQRMPEGAVHEALGELMGRGMFNVNLDEWRDRVRELSWVADASMRRVMPGTVAVAIVERQPMAIGRIGDTLNLIDRRGVIIDAFGPAYSDLDLPIVDGLGYAGEDGLDAVDRSRALLAARLLAELQRTPGLATRLSQIDVTNERDAVVMLKGETTVLHLGDRQFADRLESYLDLAPALRESAPEPDAVDLRFGARIFVRPGRQTGAARSKGMGGEQ
jgi:cell division protein FtsQ